MNPYELRPKLEARETPKDADFVYESAEERLTHPNRFFYDVPALSFGPLPRIMLESRLRTELDDNIDISSSGTAARALTRVRLLIDSGSFREVLNYRVELQDSRELFSSVTRDDPLDVRQAYLLLFGGRSIWGAKLGRQELDLGSSRLVGANWYDNLDISFDGARLTLADRWGKFEPRQWSWRVDVFAASAVEHDAGDLNGSHLGRRVAGVWYGERRTYPFRLDSMLIHAWARDESITTLSASASGSDFAWAEGFSFELEAALQLGRLNGLEQVATMCVLAASYTWPTPWQVRLGGRLAYASGDKDPSDNVSGSFISPFPGDLREDIGLIGVVGLRNAYVTSVVLGFTPLEDLHLSVCARWLSLDEPSDGWYAADGALRPISASQPYLGRELDIKGSYVFTTSSGKEFSVSGGYAVFEPASSIPAAPSRVQALYLQATLHF